MDARTAAGSQLARWISGVGPGLRVIAVAGGGVLVGAELARQLGAPLDVFIVRKIAVSRPDGEHVVGALATGGLQFIDEEEIRRNQIPDAAVAAAVAQQLRELRRLESVYRMGKPRPDLRDQEVLLVDDALHSGGTARVAMAAIRRMGARRVQIAVAVGSQEACARMRKEADRVWCAQIEPSWGQARAAWSRLGAVTEAQVKAALQGLAPV